MTKITKSNNPNKIPDQKHPHNPSPLKDSPKPSKSNPINPKSDDPNMKNNKRG